MEYNKEQEDRIRVAVSEYMLRNANLIPIQHMMNSESVEHITNIGTSIMMNKWGIDTNPGSFVCAVLDNDLTESVNRADNINRDLLPFYVTLKYNMGYIG